MKPVSRISRHLSFLAVAACLCFAGSAQAGSSAVVFGTPPWPGLTVKTEITEQLLQALGYQTQTKQLGVAFIYRDLAYRQAFHITD